MKRRLAALTAVAAAALVWAAPASAGTVTATDGVRVVFADTSGDANALTVSRAGGDVTLADSSAPLTAGAGCTQSAPNQALCKIDPEDPRASASFDLGAGNDTADLTALGLVAGVSAGAGDDTVQGTDTFDSLRGGGGADKLYGRGGNDILADEDVASGEQAAGADTLDGGADNDVAEYTDRGLAQSLSIDLASGDGGGDSLRGIESVETGPAADTIAGDAGDNSLFGSGRDRLRGRGGDDELATDSGGRLSGGGGDDKLEVNRRDARATAIACGTGHDFVASFPVDRLARDCEHANVGNAIVGIEGLKGVGPRLRRSGVLRFRLQCARDDGCSGRMRLLRSNGSVASRASYGVTDDPSYVAFRLRRADRKRLARGHLFTFASPRKGAQGFRMFLKAS